LKKKIIHGTKDDYENKQEILFKNKVTGKK
jgi:hypothetical protein